MLNPPGFSNGQPSVAISRIRVDSLPTPNRAGQWERGDKFHPPPEGNAAQAAVREGTSGLAFVDWFQRTYESTLLPKSPMIDWNKYKQHGAATLTSIVTHFRAENGGDAKLSRDEAAQMLKTIGFPVASSVQIPAQYNGSSKAKTLNKAVKAARRDHVEVAGGAAASE
jgi:hypothetical protein